MSKMIKKMICSEFDKEIEIPDISLENINKALKEMDKITNEMLNPFDSAFDKIAKDIRDRQDNVMIMEFTKCIGELLRKNGVVPKMTKYTHESVKEHSIEQLYGVSIDELDFSEHDKVFEDKIEEQKNEISILKSLIDNYRDAESKLFDEKQELNQRIVKLEKSRSEWIDKTVEWQQKCEKLESKETETCENEPISDDCRPSMEWYENRHQSDCIEISRLNTTIDVLIHKVEYLRQFAGLE